MLSVLCFDLTGYNTSDIKP